MTFLLVGCVLDRQNFSFSDHLFLLCLQIVKFFLKCTALAAEGISVSCSLENMQLKFIYLLITYLQLGICSFQFVRRLCKLI
jgi:hypothetical protein